MYYEGLKVFDKGFFWGCATSSYQVEGNNVNADWWAWEKAVGHEQSGAACRSWERYEEDFEMCKEMYHTAHRLSIEWSRVEPTEGVFDQDTIIHYQKMIKSLRARNITPFVTLHHFTLPQWLAQKGGWSNARIGDYFLRFVEMMVLALKDDVTYWMTINEPSIYYSHAFLFGWWPPQKKSLLLTWKVHNNMVKAHVRAYRRIKEIYQEHQLVSPMVSIAHHMQAFVPCGKTPWNTFAAKLRHKVFNLGIIEALIRHKALDFIGLNYYSRQLVHVKGISPRRILTECCQEGHEPLKKNSLGWDIYPYGIFELLMSLEKYKLPVFITENGICTNDEDQRMDFIERHLAMVYRAYNRGVDVKGYFLWSLLDNFEWDKGYAPHFGIISVNPQTGERTVKKSGRYYAYVCEFGAVLPPSEIIL